MYVGEVIEVAEGEGRKRCQAPHYRPEPMVYHMAKILQVEIDIPDHVSQRLT
jgi:hypothetical protein